MNQAQSPQADAPRWSLDELCKLSALSKRTVRYYLQMALMAKPFGEKRGAHYGQIHLDQLLRIRELSEAGVALDRIRLILHGDPSPVHAPPKQAGAVTVQSHIHLGEGIELVIDAQRAQLSPEQLRALAQAITRSYQHIKES